MLQARADHPCSVAEEMARDAKDQEDTTDRRDILAERPVEKGRGFMPGVSVTSKEGRPCHSARL